MGVLDNYKKWSEDNPGKKLAADLTPGIGIATSLGDAAVAASEERYGDATGELLGVVPAAKYINALTKISKAGRKANKFKEIANVADKSSDTLQALESGHKRSEREKPSKPDYETGGMKKGGKVSSASKRGDGIAQRGKTRGRMR